MSRVVIPGQQSQIRNPQPPQQFQNPQLLNSQAPVQIVQSQAPIQLINSQANPSRVVIVDGNLPETYEQQKDSDGEDEEDDEARQDKRMINFCILLLPFLLALLMFIWACRFLHRHLNTEVTLEGADNVLGYVHYNINANPINTFRETTDGVDNNCPQGFDLMHLGEWQGIERGCVCPGDDNTYARESWTKCMTFSDNGCKYQSGENDREFQYWLNSNLGYCKKSIHSENWVRSAVCDESDNTNCGPSTCLKTKDAKCPPNHWEVQNMSNPSETFSDLLTDMPSTSRSNFSYLVLRKSLKAKDGSMSTPRIAEAMYYKLGQDKATHEKVHSRSSLIGIEISQGKTRCLNKDYTQTNNVIYTLDRQQSVNTQCDKYGALVNENDATTGINVQQVTVLDTTKQNNIYATNGDLKTVYDKDNLALYNPADFVENENYLLGISKMRVNPKKECNQVFDDDLADAPANARHARNTVRVFAWFLLILTIVTVLLGVLFILAALSKYFATKHVTKVKVARTYWFSSWFLVALAILIFILWHIFFTWVIKGQEENLTGIKKADCFPDNEGVNKAINQLEVFDKEVDDNFTPIINEMFIFAIIYSIIWMAIVAFWKQKYSQVKGFINEGQ